MKPLQVGSRLAIVLVSSLLLFYIGRPLYWEALARWRPPGYAAVDVLLQTEAGGESGIADRGEAAGAALVSEDAVAGVADVQEEAPVVTTEEDGAGKEPPKDPEEQENGGSGSGAGAGAGLHSLLRRPVWEVPALGTELPAREEFRLRKELVEFRAERNVVVVTFSNHAFTDFVLTWVKHLTDLNVTNVLVGAMDDKTLESLFWAGVPVFDMGSNMNTIDVGWGSKQFHKMGREKVVLVNAFLELGYELLMCDTDMVWLQNPLPYMARFPDADVLTSSDELVHSVEDDGLEVWDKAWGAYNIGIVHWRPTTAAKAMAMEWQQMLEADDLVWDQNGFNDLMRKKLGPAVDQGDGLVYAYDGTLKLGVLPVSIFCSGHTYFVQALPEKLGLVPYAVHTTFQYGGTPGKRHRLREGKLFYDTADYYDSPDGFLTYSPELPDELLHHGKHDVRSHFNLVNYQLVQVRTALAIATILKRVLVMPILHCRLDRLWFGHPGVLPNTKTSQPFLCPMDHIFEVNKMVETLPEEDFGPATPFREYSFLRNHRVPKKVRSSVLKVELCDRGSGECEEKLAAPVSHTMVLPRNSTEEEIKAAFAAYSGVKVLEFSSIDQAFIGFQDTMKQEKFKRRLNLYTGIWCCKENINVGHIYYDFFWDTKPNWEPLPPRTPADDHHPE